MPEEQAVEAARFARSVAARRVFVEAARAAADAGTALMPLKGVLLQALVYPDPAGRTLTDADALASPGSYRPLLEKFREEGWRLARDDGYQAALAHPSLGMTLDLHETLFPEGLFEFDTAALFARGQADAQVFGVPCVLPDPLDAAAHVLAHAARDLLRRHRIPHPEDLARMADRWRIEPGRLVDRLSSVGATTAARLVVRELARRDDPFARRILEALPRDHAAVALARLLEAWGRLVPADGALARAPGGVLFRTPRAALRNVFRAVRRPFRSEPK